MDSFKQQCVALRKQDYSLLEIAKITKRPKTSVYFHIREYALSAEKRERVRASNSARIRTYSIERRGKSARMFRKFSQWNEETVFVVSHFLFDGEICRGCIYNNRNIALLNSVETAMRQFYDFEPKRYLNANTGVFRICYYNVEMAAYMKDKTEQLKSGAAKLPKEFKKVFLRAFFDDEGCMDFRPRHNHRRIRGYQKDVRVLEIVRTLLFDFGIESRIQLPNEVIITGKDNLSRFRQEIDFSAGVRINGERSNSIWKENLEKRDLLNRAIESYK